MTVALVSRNAKFNRRMKFGLLDENQVIRVKRKIMSELKGTGTHSICVPLKNLELRRRTRAERGRAERGRVRRKGRARRERGGRTGILRREERGGRKGKVNWRGSARLRRRNGGRRGTGGRRRRVRRQREAHTPRGRSGNSA